MPRGGRPAQARLSPEHGQVADAAPDAERAAKWTGPLACPSPRRVCCTWWICLGYRDCGRAGKRASASASAPTSVRQKSTKAGAWKLLPGRPAQRVCLEVDQARVAATLASAADAAAPS